MRELERETNGNSAAGTALAVVGPGRVGRAVSRAAAKAGLDVVLAGRDESQAACLEAGSALLCVPDAAIAGACVTVAEAVPPLQFVGHTSGATGLGALAAASRSGAGTFSIHPLQTITGAGSDLSGAPCAVSAAGPEALSFARDLAVKLGMHPFEVPEEARASYHAAASIASNFLVALEESAAQLLEGTGVENGRERLSPLVLRSAANWSEHGAAALTGPIARGDEETVVRHIAALERTDPALLDLYRVLAERTRAIAGPANEQAGPKVAPTKTDLKIARSKAELGEALAGARRGGATIGLVPTMGALHEGHLSLLRAARAECDLVVMSLFVNPSQFGADEDLDRYPRDESRDRGLAQAEGVDLIYAPPLEEVYPPGFSTRVEVEGLSEVLCGEAGRRGAAHFRGVTTIVAKLFNLVRPSVAYFGQKDAQQAALIIRMAEDLDFGVRIAVAPTVREPDGLAMSSRNAYLSAEERQRAAAIYRALRAAGPVARNGSLGAALEAVRRELSEAGIEPEYVEARDAETLAPAGELNGRPVLLAVAARVGEARLIDNILLDPTVDEDHPKAAEAGPKGAAG